MHIIIFNNDMYILTVLLNLSRKHTFSLSQYEKPMRFLKHIPCLYAKNNQKPCWDSYSYHINTSKIVYATKACESKSSGSEV
ncbi:hypothetical protein NEPAR04_0487 [Nematocida parisii]|nr:hypothetical protein NEPAR03_0715 [Nematocida parisii]KAI5128299.1 hypothetical protein NEPAR08_1163 [Nematocida parisii]KAI5140770.1 hypothetical protein NEPAR04_0487 [Nematocida parisii]